MLIPFVAARALPLVFQYDVHGSMQSRAGLRSTRWAGTICSPLITRYWYAATLTHPSAISSSKTELNELPTPCSPRRVLTREKLQNAGEFFVLEGQ